MFSVKMPTFALFAAVTRDHFTAEEAEGVRRDCKVISRMLNLLRWPKLSSQTWLLGVHCSLECVQIPSLSQ